MKYSYCTHIQEGSEDAYHDPKFGLKYGTFESKFRKSKCRECNSVFKFITEVRESILNVTTSIDKILTSSANKFEMYMGHKIRAHIQEKKIRSMFEWLRNGSERKRVVTYVDFKMKVEPERHRETQVQYFGKSGMSWHGAAIFYKPLSDGDNMYKPRKEKRAMSEEELSAYNEVEKRKIRANQETKQALASFFVDHIAENDKKQDRVFTASIVEALVYRIHRQLP